MLVPVIHMTMREWFFSNFALGDGTEFFCSPRCQNQQCFGSKVCDLLFRMLHFSLWLT